MKTDFVHAVLLQLIVAFSSVSLHAQCYTPLRTEGLAAYEQAQYKEAINLLFAARSCPDKPKNDDLDRLLKQAMEAWENRLNAALSEARTERDNALEQKEKAEHLARGSNNASLVFRLKEENPTLALRLAEFNWRRYPDNEAAAAAFGETFNGGHLFYKKEIKEPTYVTSVKFTPDGQYFVVGRRKGGFDIMDVAYTLALYDRDGNFVRSLVPADFGAKKQFGGVEEIAMSADGNKILVGTYIDSVAYLIDAAGTLLNEFAGHGAQTVALSPDGRLAVTGSSSEEGKLWNTETGEMVAVLDGHHCENVQFSPDGEYILIRDDEGYSYLWTKDGEVLFNYPGEDAISLYDIKNDFSADGHFFVTAGASVTLWGIQDSVAINFESDFIGLASVVAVSNDGEYIAGGTTTGEILVWDQYGNLLQTCPAHKEVVTSIDFSPDGRSIVSGSADRTVKIWRWGEAGDRVLENGGKTPNKLAFDSNGRLLCSYENGDVALWNLEADTIERSLFTGEYYLEPGIAFSPGGRYLLRSTTDSSAVFWDLEVEKQLDRLVGHYTFYGFDSYVMGAAISPDEQYLLTSGSDRRLNLWELATREKLLTVEATSGGLFDLIFTPDSKQFLHGSKDRTVKRYDLEGNLLMTYPGHREWVSALALSPDGQYLASGDFEGLIQIHHIDGARLHSFGVPGQIIFAIAFSPDGRYLATVSSDGKVRLWSLSGQEIQVFPGEAAWTQSILFSPDGQEVVAVTANGDIRFWPLWNKVLDQQVAPIPLSVLIREGMQISKAEFIARAQKEQDAGELVALYKVGKAKEMEFDLLNIMLSRSQSWEQADVFLQAIVADYSAFTMENLMDAMQGKTDRFKQNLGMVCALAGHAMALGAPATSVKEYANYFNEYAWYQLLSGEFAEAESTLRQGIELDPENPYLRSNLPPALLFQGKYEEAMPLYEANATEMFPAEEDGRSFAQVFLADFKAFENAKVIPAEHTDQFEKVKKMLTEVAEKK